MIFLGHQEGGMKMVIDSLTVLTEIIVTANKTFEDWAFNRKSMANIALNIVKYDFLLFLFSQLHS